MILDLFENAIAMAGLALVYAALTLRFDLARPLGGALAGLFFGAAAVALMNMPFVMTEGLIFDMRTVVVSLGALFGGLVTGVVAALVAALYRLWLGGAGAMVGVASVVAAAVGGLALRRLLHGEAARVRWWHLLLLGGGVTLLVVALFLFLPIDFESQVLRRLAVPYLVTGAVGTLLVGLLLRESGRLHRFERLLAESRERFERLYDSSSVAILQEDLSGVLEELERLRKAGVVDLRAFLAETPERLGKIAARIRVTDANPAALALFGAGRRRTLPRNIGQAWGPDADRILTEALCALWRGDPVFASELTMRRLDGSSFPAAISLPLPKTRAEARLVPVTIADFSDLKRVEGELAEERRRLQEIIWGTNVGTWEWNVPTGETVFNERWAEMLGYRLAELEPVDIATWEALTHPDDLPLAKAALERVFAREEETYEVEFRMRHRDGHWVWVLDRGKVVAWDEGGAPLRMSGTHSDVSKRRTAELRITRIAAVRDAVLHCHRAFLETDGERELLQRTCEILEQARDYRLVWIALPGADGGHLEPAARSGGAVDPDPAARAGVEGAPDPLGEAFAGERTRVLRGAAVPSVLRAGRVPEGEKAGSLAAIPVLGGGQALALLCVHSLVEDAFDEEEVALLTEFAGHLGLAVTNLRVTRANAEMSGQLARSALAAVGAIAKTVEMRDPYTSGHQQRVARLSVAIARRLGWDEGRIEGLRLGALLHDIGKIYVPAEILNRPGLLSDEEMAIIRTHPGIGGEILKDTDFPWPIREMVEQHHERIDGSGYPKGLKGSEILEEAKVIAVADVVEAIAAHRPYRPSRGIEAGLEEIERGRGLVYDPAAVDACLAVIREEGFDLEGGEGRAEATAATAAG